MLNLTLRETRITLALEQFCLYNQISYAEAENIKRNYLEVCENSSVQFKLNHFNKDLHSIDNYFFNELDLKSDLNFPFFNFCKRVFVLFHGNAAVESGFSVNADCLVEHLEEDSLIAQRSIYSAISEAGGVLGIEITKSMLLSFRSSSSRREAAIIDKRKKKDDHDNEIKSASIQIAALKEKQKLVTETLKQEANSIDEQIMNTSYEVRF